ncbi:MAG: hypothetical protein V4689_18095 [Verrucomicrobiota bacterium]
MDMDLEEGYGPNFTTFGFICVHLRFDIFFRLTPWIEKGDGSGDEYAGESEFPWQGVGEGVDGGIQGFPFCPLDLIGMEDSREMNFALQFEERDDPTRSRDESLLKYVGTLILLLS